MSSSRGEELVRAIVLTAAFAAGCGASDPPPSEAIWHTPELQPSVVPAHGDAERLLLERLSTLPSGAPVSLGGDTFELGEPYASASGRHCRVVEASGSQRLACSAMRGDGWVFVPEVATEALP